MHEPSLDAAIRDGLLARPRRLPPALLYDALGSTLFEAITQLPEYGVTRADLSVIQAHREDVFAALPGPVEVLELGPGSGRKAALLLEPLVRRQGEVAFTAVDVSRSALEECQRTLEASPAVKVRMVEATFLAGLETAARREGCRRLVFLLGSNLSNYLRPDAGRFLADVRAALRPGDALLLATDLEKPPALLIPAYDDALGVTAAFNKNVLLRLNRGWGARFPLASFQHRAVWNAAERRVEMWLVATEAVSTEVLGVEVTMAPGEHLWTESSLRFSLAGLREWGARAGFTCLEQWTCKEWTFAHSLFLVP